MPKRTSKEEDFSTIARRVVEQAIGEPLTPEPKPISSTVSRVMAQMGRRGGKKGGKRRLETMTPEQRSQVALKAAQARWAKKKQG
jgi:hypothetical protein